MKIMSRNHRKRKKIMLKLIKIKITINKNMKMGIKLHHIENKLDLISKFNFKGKILMKETSNTIVVQKSAITKWLKI